MSTLALHNNTHGNSLLEALPAFKIIRDLSESELETLEILSDPETKKLLERSLSESKANKVFPVETIL
ncbi:hypothetical protein L0Y49_02575 [bacterium]|nr:hypothetical protein [bacterium]